MCVCVCVCEVNKRNDANDVVRIGVYADMFVRVSACGIKMRILVVK